MKPSHSGLRIQLLGSFVVYVNGTAVENSHWRLQKARAVVAMLALASGQRGRRDQVLDRLWPDLEPVAAARNLHQTLYVARRTLAGSGTGSTGLLAIRGDVVVLDDTGPVAVDVLQFERSAAAALAAGAEASLREAAGLYSGDLLPDLPDAEWLTMRRGELRETHREVLVKLASVVAQRAPEEALAILTRALESDPVHEGAVRAQMTALAALGRRSEALARYERLVDDLLDTFGTDPDPRTAGLFRELLTGSPPEERRRRPDGVAGIDDVVGHLPSPLTSFIGRERELVDVERLISRARLLTLTGAGGSGKTRLALEAAKRARPGYVDGVWFVDLAGVGEPLLVADAVAEALDLDSGAAPNRMRALVDQLRRHSLLLVLDNCEHLLSACAQLVVALLAGAPDVKVLATSREPLHVDGEYTFRVPSLPLPSPVGADAPDLAEIGLLPSVRLFVERSAQVRPGFTLDAGNAQEVVELCRRLDGMPLALELAAARTAVLEPGEIVQRLDDALSMLSGGSNVATRRQTLRGTLEWSHDLLAEHEQVLLRRLSVFAGGFTLDAVEAVCPAATLNETELFDLLAKLVDKSLVVTERTAAGTRYRQLETVRLFCQENLDRAGETSQLAQAHCAHFLAFAVAHNPERAIGIVIEQPTLLDREHDNLRAALRWSCAHEPDTALRLAASLWRYWFVRGHAVEGARWVERALAVASGPTRPRAAALIGLTGLYSRQGRSDRHRALGAEALEIVRQIGEPHEVVMARLVETSLAWSTFDLDEAEQLAVDVHTEAVDAGRAEYAAASSWLLGQCALSREDGPRAAGHLETCLRELGQSDTSAPPFLPVITPSLQLVPIVGRLVPCLEETLLLGRRVGAIQATGYVLSALGYAARLSADPTSALALIEDAAELFAELGDDLARAQTLHQLGCILRDTGENSAAAQALSQAWELRHGLGDRRGELLTEINTALLHAMDGEIYSGLADARRCLSGFDSAGDQVGVGATLTILGAIELMSGEVRAAREMYRRAAERVDPWRRHAGWQRLMVAELSNDLGDRQRAGREMEKAAAIFDQTRCVIASQRLAVLRSQYPGGDGGILLSSR
ncbi:AfsR/SARP family transcriptional regulator [Arthrobacter sp. 35W]|uniref:AfsR/SARP family transcriptional regulator n=1 Tax=Arthrobacter sp. 35W TaxID=1132441 RepID=UPI000419DA88|nr:BTAD domain-containing putative transcriptional regulator [Arthrobacter sp. 35W]